MTEREPTALEMWSARQGVVISGIAVDRAHRTEVDLARAEVERLSVEVAKLTADRDEWCQKWTELGRGNRALAAEVADLTAERDRARDLAVRAGAFEGCPVDGCLDCVALEAERDQALYERDAALRDYAVELNFVRGLIPTRPR